MKYETDSRKNCASPMKRTHNFFSAAHFAIPLPTVTCNLAPVTWIHTFSAKEKDTETGLSYFGSRYYSSDLSIWLSVDPMSDKYPSLSPYVYCANNPIKLVDPNGMEIDPESMQAWNSLKADILKRKDFLEVFASINKFSGGVLFQKEAFCYNSICETLNSMDNIEISDQKYRLEKKEGNTGSVSLNDDWSLTINYCNTANFVHELTHCAQFERGEIGFQEGGGSKAYTDIYDEISAYTAQFAYDPSTISRYNRYAPLTPNWIIHMRDSNGQYIYNNCALIPFDGNATASDMNRIFPSSLESFNFEGKLRDQPGTYFK